MFQRLDLAERRGSGIKKIRKEYENSDRQPVFFSDESWFTTTLYNLNYGVNNDTDSDTDVAKDVPFNNANVSKDVSLDVTKNVPNEDERRRQIITLIEKNEVITSSQLSQMMGVTRKTITRDLQKLKSAGVIIRVGGKRFGRWEIVRD